MSTSENERKNLHSRLLDAVRACQTHLGGKQELVTEASSWISCLCTQLEAVLQHRLKPSVRGLSAIRQVAGASLAEETPLWYFVKNHLTKHEVERFETLHNINTDVGRGRAWIRCSLNEHSLDRYFQMLISDIAILRKYYESDAFMLDEEKTSTLPQMAAGLGSIYFNIKYNDSSLDGTLNKPQQYFGAGFIPNLISASNVRLSKNEEQTNDAALEAQLPDKVKKRAGRKKRAKIISFGDEDSAEGSLTPAEKGGSGYVVLNQSFTMKSSASLTSESSSGVFSSESNSLEQRKKEHISAVKSVKTRNSPLHSSTTTVEPRNAGSSESLNILKNHNSGNHDQRDLLAANLQNDLEISSNSHQPSSLEITNNTGKVNKTSTPSKSPQPVNSTSQIKASQIHPDEHIGHVTQHLISVRHDSVLSSHDLVMDDWSEQSNSTSGLALAAENSTQLYPIHNEYESSDSRSDILTNTDADNSASLALSLAQKPSNSWQKHSNGLDILDNVSQDAMTADELRQALVALMHRKEEIMETNKSMRSLLDSEMEHSAALRREIETLRSTLKQQTEESAALQQQHNRENEVLRNQLKKYVGAVQALQRGEQTVDMPSDLNRLDKPSDISTSEESELYEKKLIEVAEMHGELMEFNERLHVRLQSAISLLHNMKTELTDLRGPMPNDDLISRIENDNLSGTTPYSPPLTRALINIWIPSSFLKGKGGNSHHVFQVYVRISDEEWNVYRRYSHFHELHMQLRKKYPIVDSYGFPRKKAIRNKSKKFVEDRRKGLQIYLRLLMNNVVQNHEKIVAKPDKNTLTSLLPFFSESLDVVESTSNQSQQNRTRRS